MRWLAAVALGLMLLPSAVAAAPVTYDCRAQQRNYPSTTFSAFQNPIQPRLTFVVDEAAGTASVSDPLIDRVLGAPLAADLTLESDRKLTITWDLNATGFGGAQSRMHFRAALLKHNNKLIVTASPLSTGERFHARGACVWDGMAG